MGKKFYSDVSAIKLVVIKGAVFMKKIFVSLVCFLLIDGAGYARLEKNQDESSKKRDQKKEAPFEVKGRYGKYSKLKNQILCYRANQLSLRFAKIIRDDLNFTDQFDVDLKKTDQTLKQIKLPELFKQGISLVTFFYVIEQEIKKKRKIEKNIEIHVLIKDTNSKATVFDKKVTLEEKNLVTQGHNFSADILQALTGDKGVCLSSIAYCKMLSSYHKVICLADYACKQSCEVVSTKAVNVAPSWHTKSPVLFYSQLTKSNNRLMSIDLRTNKHKIICSYAGLNMQPAFSADGKTSVVCLSGGKGNSELYLYDPRLCKKAGKRVFSPLTRNGAHNVSPCMLENNDVVFCSDFQTGLPQIYYLERKTKKIRRLTNGEGYCAAPSYCAKTNILVYTRPVKGVFQLFSLSLDNFEEVQEQQITFCQGNKHEPSWSECGRYIAFSLDLSDKKNKRFVSQVAALNYKSGKIRVLTRGPEAKSFPRWTGQKLW